MLKNRSEEPLLLGIVQMGVLEELAVRVVAANLQAFIGLPVDVLGFLDAPPDAYQPHRRQFDAGLILRYLSETSSTGHVRTLALTTVDLCSPILTYVYGEAEIGGSFAVVSDFRLRSNEDGSISPLDRYYERLAKASLHEMAHTFSVYHCEDSKCLMHFSPKIRHLDEVDIHFCARCEFMLQKGVRSL